MDIISINPLLRRRIEYISNGNKSYVWLKEPKITLQNGFPHCGLVALLMMRDTLNFPPIEETKDLLNVAIDKGFSNKGEIFSVRWLSEIAKIFWNDSAIFDVLDKLPNDKTLVEELSSSDIVYLIPYDCGKNFEPVFHNGNNAHWSLITGFVLVKNSNQDEENNVNKTINFYTPAQTINIQSSSLYVIGYQGKSRHPGVWNYKSLIDSNLQLHTCREDGKNEFKFDINGMEDLRGKCLRVKRR
uniref:Actin maturation protease n=1 Tax=Strongyloides venezuelensis TaxID=75913 RepID=A0A0K0EWK1_STRVS